MNQPKPEHILKRAEDLIAVGEKGQALSTLHELIVARPPRKIRTWSKPYEEVLMLHVSLCVELRRGKLARDALPAYRNLTQTTHPSSLESVIQRFLQLSEERATEAQSKADQTTLELLEDLEDESPESVVLTSVSGEDSKFRTERELVTPWLRLLWETYRTILETLRSNLKLDSLYHKTAQRAFQFCSRYRRPGEFRRLCDVLRMHLLHIKNTGQLNDLAEPERLQLALDTRFIQLETAISLDLWQEAYRSVEDVHGMLNLSKKPPKQSVMAHYYTFLTRIFWASENYMFNAHARYRLYALSKSLKPLKDDEVRLLATQVVLATLSIPLEERRQDDSQLYAQSVEKDRNIKMAQLLGFNLQPKASSTQEAGARVSAFVVPHLRDLYANILDISRSLQPHVLPEIAGVYRTLEDDFAPLDLCARMRPVFAFIGSHESLREYLLPLQRVTLSRTILQLSRVYKTFRIDALAALVDFFEPAEIEKQVLMLVRHGVVRLRFDHRSGAILFEQRFLETDQMRHQLTTLASQLQRAMAMIDPAALAERQRIKQQRLKDLVAAIPDEHQHVLSRKGLIETRKEEQDRGL
eukprot:TRINITY_DN2337_c1_g1_i2.p1 TRINITY_DN2337_c1_g1~~TRINITY_DN2337_c1_g1_i2.p1  ORF type:complete len:582 (-),score=174.00 TRINITY_DN2337_c1_g1_i2:1289-3034(-)